MLIQVISRLVTQTSIAIVGLSMHHLELISAHLSLSDGLFHPALQGPDPIHHHVHKCFALSQARYPNINEGMDVYYSQIWAVQSAASTSQVYSAYGPIQSSPAQITCASVRFGNICSDDFGSNWTLTTEVGCAMVLILLTAILGLIQTSIALYFICFNCNAKQEDFLAGAEDGCCGIASVMISCVAFDGGSCPKTDSSAGKLRRAIHFVTIIFLLPILAAVCSAISIVTAPTAWDNQRSSIFVLYPCLLLNLYSLLHNVAEATTGLW